MRNEWRRGGGLTGTGGKSASALGAAIAAGADAEAAGTGGYAGTTTTASADFSWSSGTTDPPAGEPGDPSEAPDCAPRRAVAMMIEAETGPHTISSRPRDRVLSACGEHMR